MIIEHVIWTALPRGFTTDGLLRVSLHVAPRLTTDDANPPMHKLGDFPSFVSWPDRLATLEFEAVFDTGQSVAAKPAPDADASLWAALFSAGTPVRPHAYQDHALRDFHVFPVRPVLQFLKETYGGLAAAGPGLPLIDDATGPLTAFEPLSGMLGIAGSKDVQSWYREIGRAHDKAAAKAAIENGQVPPVVSDGMVVVDDVADASLSWSQQQAQTALFQAYRFYRRPGSDRPDFDQDYVEPKPTVPKPEFHEIVAMVADHPTLLRRLGLVVDLVVQLPDPGTALPGEGVIRIVPKGELPEDPPNCPGTRYELDGDWFGAKPNHEFELERGMLRLSPEMYDLFQVDVDGAALQVVGFADTLDRLKDPGRRSQATPAEQGAPVLRSTGLALARVNRGDILLEGLLDRRGKNQGLESGSNVEFDAEHLVRGYRVDVLDEDAPGGPRWFSLHDRISTHTIDGFSPPLPPIRDEGYLKSTAASGERSDHPVPSDDLYLHETIAAWEGWSLAAARPGKRIVEPGEGEPTNSAIARFDPGAGHVLPIVTTIEAAPKTLPRLRLGRTYRLRIRTVDLAGNSRDFQKGEIKVPGLPTASEAQRYLRFEPVPSPTVLRRHLDTEGESLEHLIIRSDDGVSAGDYAASSAVAEALAKAGAAHTYAADSQRHLAPPKGSELMAEQDGRLEPAFGGTPAKMTAQLRVALREEGTFLEPTIVNAATGQRTVAQSTIATFPTGTPLPARGQPLLPNGAYAYHPDPKVTLPYLPDPLAIGVALTGYNFDGTEVFHQVALFPDKWPELRPFRLRLSEIVKPSDPPNVEFKGEVLEVRLPQAYDIRAQLSSIFPDGRLDDLAIWQWMPELDQQALKTDIIEGRHWMLTPFRWVGFTHAVQHPLAVPNMSNVGHTRAPGATYAEFDHAIVCNARSTGRLDVLAEWTEDVDLLTDDAPRMQKLGTEVHHTAHAFGFDLTPGEDQAVVTRPEIKRTSRHEFGDTKYRRVVYHSVATTRFREVLPRPIADDPVAIQRVEDVLDGNGTPKAKLVHHVKSTARPAAPDPLYVVPTFRWERHDDGPTRTHVRHGNAVRVWLRRPWFSSGDGEQLGVVLEPASKLPRGWVQAKDSIKARATAIDVPIRANVRRRAAPTGRTIIGASGPVDHLVVADANLSAVIAGLPTKEQLHAMLHPYVTKWGNDPVWTSRVSDQPPTVSVFPRRVSSAGPLTLDELPPTARVMVAGHEVMFDDTTTIESRRRLWYCDVELDPGRSYFPFIRFALARYQPMSIPNMHLSRVVQTDFIQVVPDRTAVLTLAPAGAKVTVSGYAGRNVLGPLTPLPDILFEVGGVDPDAPNTTMKAVLERRTPGIPGDLGWQRVGSEVKLAAKSSGFNVTWSGVVPLPEGADDDGDHRILITEIETFPRDLLPGDPNSATSRLDFVRERIVFADAFDL